jgi:hypothetical protein
VTKIGVIAAAALLVGAFASAPSAASEQPAAPDGRDVAAQACLSINEYGPAEVTSTVEDGLGDWIVWVRDKDGDLWLCNASSQGNVFANAMTRGDLLAGRGQQALALMPVTRASSVAATSETAERLCAAAGRKVDATRVVTSVEDGTGDYVVWLAASDGSYWLCNASADAKLYIFEHVDNPLNQTPIDPANRSA